MSRPPDDSGGDARGLAMLSGVVAQLVVPILLGVWLDDRYQLAPLGLILGSVLGLGGTFTSLVVMSRKQDRHGGKPPSDT